MADQFSDLPAAAAALSVEDREELFNDLNNKLHNVPVQYIDVLETLSPKVRKRVEYLKEIQSEYDELEAKFFVEKAALQAKYQTLYQPLYEKRSEIVTGEVEVDGLTNEASTEKGIPDFWLIAFKNNEVVAEEINERDEVALKYLRDIKWCKTDNPKGFKLEFFFDSNPYFKNSVLTKTYIMLDEEEPILEKAIGTDIEWFPGKCLTQKVLKKKPKKGSKSTKPITKTEACESFFNFFDPPEVPATDAEMDMEDAEELQEQMEQDYDVGSTIRDKIIPHAVLWYTGEACEEDEYDETDDEENDFDDDDLEDGDNDNEEQEVNVKKVGKAQAGGGEQGQRPAECKQQ